jgi:hypothetical protein
VNPRPAAVLVLVGCAGAVDRPPEGVDPATGVDCALPALDDEACPFEVLGCDQVVESTTRGGADRFDRATWEGAICLDWLASDGGDMQGPDRVYVFDVPADTTASVTLTSPCARLDLRVVNTTTACNTSPTACSVGSGDLSLSRVTALIGGLSGRRYEIIVDGYDGDAGSFRLQTACSGPAPR